MASEAAFIGNAAFSAAPSDLRIVHPLSASPASSAFFTPHPHQSCSPPPAQPQPQQHQQQQTNGNPNPAEDVTTIFVVGFPEDMQEREFQNMFTFSPGFEAASLKWHCKDQDDENMTGNNSIASGGAKKQMIGFARFRTRLEAMEAVEVLSGKKIDAKKGSVLKAEMAKKNLHIKRGSIAPNAHTSAVAAQHHQQAVAAAAAAAAAAVDTGSSPLSILSRKMSLHAPPPPAAYDMFSPLPSDLLSPADYKNDPFNDHPLANGSTNFNDALFGSRSQSFDARNNDLSTIISPRAFSLYPRTAATAATGARIFNHHPFMHDPDQDPFNYLSKSSPVANDRPAHSTSSSLFDHGNDILSSRMGSLSINTSNHHELRAPSLSSPSYRPNGNVNSTPGASATNTNSSSNPADQNPPCNTLYVGNLPPYTSEEELRQVFSKCRGYKRMCFRTKPQGPMCFVEFEDVVFATQAMNELQGHNLSNSVKGGIRLSFSKNPLFTKPAKQQTTDRSRDTILEHAL